MHIILGRISRLVRLSTASLPRKSPRVAECSPVNSRAGDPDMGLPIETRGTVYERLISYLCIDSSFSYFLFSFSSYLAYTGHYCFIILYPGVFAGSLLIEKLITKQKLLSIDLIFFFILSILFYNYLSLDQVLLSRASRIQSSFICFINFTSISFGIGSLYTWLVSIPY